MRTLSTRRRSRSAQGAIRPCEGMRTVHPHAAGIDMGAQDMVACVPTGDAQQIVRTFGTSTVDLQTLADWFLERGIETVAMASTGVYGIPPFAVLEARGLHCCLISASSITRVPGRQSDVLDCQWMQTLHRDGLLSAALRPEADLVALRTLLRHRAQLIAHRAPHVLPMHKARVQMHIQLAPALSEVTGDTGQRILRASVAGERAPHTLAALRNSRWKKAADDSALALTGPWREAQLFVLKHALALFDCYTTQISACDAQIALAFSAIQPRFASAPGARDAAGATPPPRRQPHAHSTNAPEVDTRAPILRMTGVDLVAVQGSSDAMAQTMRAEIGTDRRKWPTDKHFCSWRGLAPKNNISGGTVLKSRTMQHRHRATQAFRMAAQSVSRSYGAFGAFSRRMKGRFGPAQALVATAHKVARTVSHLLKNRVQYHDIGAAEYTVP